MGGWEQRDCLRDRIQNTSEMTKSKMTAMSFYNWVDSRIYKMENIRVTRTKLKSSLVLFHLKCLWDTQLAWSRSKLNIKCRTQTM